MMHPALAQTDHRPWPVPRGRWTWRQVWYDLLFAHWPVEQTALRHLVPPELDIQQFDGTSWIGVVPFQMEGVMRRPFPDLPGFSAFPELNVRLYVEQGGKPGVWFLSLDADQALAVWGGRTLFRLPYHRAHMHLAMADWSEPRCTMSPGRCNGRVPGSSATRCCDRGCRSWTAPRPRCCISPGDSTSWSGPANLAASVRGSRATPARTHSS